MDVKKFEGKMWYYIKGPLTQQVNRQYEPRIRLWEGVGFGFELGNGLEWKLEKALKDKYGQKKV